MANVQICDWCGNPLPDSFPSVAKSGTETTDYCSWPCLAAWATGFLPEGSEAPSRMNQVSDG